MLESLAGSHQPSYDSGYAMYGTIGTKTYNQVNLCEEGGGGSTSYTFSLKSGACRATLNGKSLSMILSVLSIYVRDGTDWQNYRVKSRHAVCDKLGSATAHSKFVRSPATSSLIIYAPYTFTFIAIIIQAYEHSCNAMYYHVYFFAPLFFLRPVTGIPPLRGSVNGMLNNCDHIVFNLLIERQAKRCRVAAVDSTGIISNACHDGFSHTFLVASPTYA